MYLYLYMCIRIYASNDYHLELHDKKLGSLHYQLDRNRTGLMLGLISLGIKLQLKLSEREHEHTSI